MSWLSSVRTEFDVWKWRTIGAVVVGVLIILGLTWYRHAMIPRWWSFWAIVIPVVVVQIWHRVAERHDF